MNGREVYKFAVVKFNRVIKRMLKETGLSIDDIDLIVPHQSNLRMIESMQQKLGNFDSCRRCPCAYAARNTGCASIELSFGSQSVHPTCHRDAS